ncbi:hypothetical protein [Lolliginicoccus lacisalsi]|uniref:hypothetical protein n=1 Tax=Lolliginicoccus lacisalsi TaxID=2742202 RepID=UPI001CDCED78|nr:hypothetical protein [Lolliginicoccus lacisalsi]
MNTSIITATDTRPSAAPLRAALRANATFSLVTGLATLALAWWLAGSWNVPVALLVAIGASVAVFGVAVATAAALPDPALRRAAPLPPSSPLTCSGSQRASSSSRWPRCPGQHAPRSSRSARSSRSSRSLKPSAAPASARTIPSRGSRS